MTYASLVQAWVLTVSLTNWPNVLKILSYWANAWSKSRHTRRFLFWKTRSVYRNWNLCSARHRASCTPTYSPTMIPFWPQHWKKRPMFNLQILLASKPVCLLKWVACVCHLRHCLRLPYFYSPRALALLCQTKSPLVPDQQATKKLLWNSGVILHKHFHQLIEAPKRIGLGQYSRT